MPWVGLSLSLRTYRVPKLSSFFMVSAMAGAGIQSWLITILHQMHGLAIEAASAALTGYMIGATAGLTTMASAQVVPPAVVVTPPPNPSSTASVPSNSALPGSVVVRLNVRLVADSWSARAAMMVTRTPRASPP